MRENLSALNRLKLPLLVIAAVIGGLATESPAEADCIPSATTACRWKRWENSFQVTTGGYTRRQMYEMEIAVTYSKGAQSFTGVGFWDGGAGTPASPATFRFRAAFPDLDKWNWSTACVAGACVGNSNFTRSGVVTVVAYSDPDNHVLYAPTKGFLEVPEAPYWNPPPYLWAVPSHVGGDRFYWLGDSAWAAPMKATLSALTNPDTAIGYLSNRKNRTFSVVHYGMPGAWMGELNAAGQRAFCAYPSAGSCDQPNYAAPIPNANTTPNPAFWQWFDSVIDATNDAGLVAFVAGIMSPIAGDPTHPTWDPTPTNYAPSTAEAVIFARWLAARLSGNHLVFSPGFDQEVVSEFDPSHPDHLNTLIIPVGAEIHRVAPRHLVTFHWSNASRIGQTRRCNNDPAWDATRGMETIQSEGWLSFQMFQSGHIACSTTNPVEYPMRRAVSLAQALRGQPTDDNPVPPTVLLDYQKPTVNGEAVYDAGEQVDDENARHTRYRARQAAFLSTLNGAFGYSFGVLGVWDWGLCMIQPTWCGSTPPVGYRNYRDAMNQVSSNHMQGFRRHRERLDTEAFFANEQLRILDSGNFDSTNYKNRRVLLRDASRILVYAPNNQYVTVDFSGLGVASPASLVCEAYDPSNANALDEHCTPANCSPTNCRYSNPRWAAGNTPNENDTVFVIRVTSPDSDGAEGGFTVSVAQDEVSGVWGLALERSGVGAASHAPGAQLAAGYRDQPSQIQTLSNRRGVFALIWRGGGELWGNSEIWMRRFDGAGLPLDEDPILVARLADASAPAAAIDEAGDVFVVWQEAGEARATRRLVGGYFELGSASNDADIVVGESLLARHARPQVEALPGGRFVIAWQDRREGDLPGRIAFTSVDRFGTLAAVPIEVTPAGGDVNLLAGLHVDGDSTLTVEWERWAAGRSGGRWRQAFSLEGDALSAPLTLGEPWDLF